MTTVIENGIQFNIDNDNVSVMACEDLEGEVRVPEYMSGELVVEAEPYAFSRRKITQLELPRHLKKIGRYAFYRCFTLKKLCFSDALMDIGAGAFTGCNPKEIEIDFYNGY